MRGDDSFQDELFSYGGLAERVPAKHPLRRIRDFADSALEQLSSEFDRLYAKIGRPSIAPEQLLRALLLQMLYSLRSERMLVDTLFDLDLTEAMLAEMRGQCRRRGGSTRS